MPFYDLKCRFCKIEWEVFSSVDTRNTHTCDKCWKEDQRMSMGDVQITCLGNPKAFCYGDKRYFEGADIWATGPRDLKRQCRNRMINDHYWPIEVE